MEKKTNPGWREEVEGPVTLRDIYRFLNDILSQPKQIDRDLSLDITISHDPKEGKFVASIGKSALTGWGGLLYYLEDCKGVYSRIIYNNVKLNAEQVKELIETLKKWKDEDTKTA